MKKDRSYKRILEVNNKINRILVESEIPNVDSPTKETMSAVYNLMKSHPKAKSAGWGGKAFRMNDSEFNKLLGIDPKKFYDAYLKSAQAKRDYYLTSEETGSGKLTGWMLVKAKL
jgi:hypothetical protein